MTEKGKKLIEKLHWITNYDHLPEEEQAIVDDIAKALESPTPEPQSEIQKDGKEIDKDIHVARYCDEFGNWDEDCGTCDVKWECIKKKVKDEEPTQDGKDILKCYRCENRINCATYVDLNNIITDVENNGCDAFSEPTQDSREKEQEGE